MLRLLICCIYIMIFGACATLPTSSITTSTKDVTAQDVRGHMLGQPLLLPRVGVELAPELQVPYFLLITTSDALYLDRRGALNYWRRALGGARWKRAQQQLEDRGYDMSWGMKEVTALVDGVVPQPLFGKGTALANGLKLFPLLKAMREQMQLARELGQLVGRTYHPDVVFALRPTTPYGDFLRYAYTSGMVGAEPLHILARDGSGRVGFLSATKPEMPVVRVEPATVVGQEYCVAVRAEALARGANLWVSVRQRVRGAQGHYSLHRLSDTEEQARVRLGSTTLADSYSRLLILEPNTCRTYTGGSARENVLQDKVKRLQEHLPLCHNAVPLAAREDVAWEHVVATAAQLRREQGFSFAAHDVIGPARKEPCSHTLLVQ